MMSTFEDVLKLLSERHTEEVSYYRNQLEELKRQHQEEIEKRERQYKTNITKAKIKIEQKSQETQKLRDLLTQNGINTPPPHEMISTDEFRSNLSHSSTSKKHVAQEESTHNEKAPPTNHGSITSLSHSPITPSTPDTSKKDTPTLCDHTPPVVQSPHKKSLQLIKPKNCVVYRKSGPKKELTTKPQHDPPLFCDTESINPKSVNGEDTGDLDLSIKSSEGLETLSNETIPVSPADSETFFTSHYQNEQEIDDTLDETEGVVSPSLLKESDNNVTPEQNSSICTDDITAVSVLDNTPGKLSQSSRDPENLTNVKKRQRKNQPAKRTSKKRKETKQTQHINTSTINESYTNEEDIPVVITPPLIEDNDHDVTMMTSSDGRAITHQDLSPYKLSKSSHIVPPTPWIKPSTSKPQYPWQQELISGINPVTSSHSTNCNIVSPQPNNTMTSPLKRPASDVEIIDCDHHDNKSSSHMTHPPKDKRTSKAKKTKTNSHENTRVTKKLTEEQQLAQQAGLPTYSCKVSIRKKDDRAKLPGTACPDCARWFQGGQGIYENKKEHLLKACRHKHLYKPPESDPSLWKIGFPDSPDTSNTDSSSL